MSALWGACYVPLDKLPADLVATAQWFQEEEANFGFAEFILESNTCIVLDPKTTRITLNGTNATWFEMGGRGREPFDAFNPYCAAPYANWESNGQLANPLVFRMEDNDHALEFIVDLEREILQCDFPTCRALNLSVERPAPVR